MPRPIAPNYEEQYLFPPAVEDWVPRDHPVRFIREFVDELNLAELGFLMPTALEGRPPYAPGLLLKIWLYGYYHRVRSTRRLETACREVLPLIWLCGNIAPDHNSLWRFWQDNRKALGEVFKQSVKLAVRTGAVGLALQALDSTRIQAAGSTESGWSKDYMTKVLAALDQAAKETELKVAQENSQRAVDAVSLPAGMAERKALRQQIQEGLAQLAADNRKHYHPVEPEARRMALRHQNRYAYNAQAVADEKGIVVACDVTRQEHEKDQLVRMVEHAKENLGVDADSTVTVADGGYGAGTDVAGAAERNLNVLVSPAEGSGSADNPYAAQHFKFDAARHTVTCPQGQQLRSQGETIKKGMKVQRFRCQCPDCPVRKDCTRDPKGRQIEVWPHTAAVQQMRERLKDPSNRALLARRKEIIERRFAQIKEHDGFRRWTVWGLESVRAQWAMVCTVANLRLLYQRWRTARPSTVGAAIQLPRPMGLEAVKVLIAASAQLWRQTRVLIAGGLKILFRPPVASLSLG
jgi:transposase